MKKTFLKSALIAVLLGLALMSTFSAEGKGQPDEKKQGEKQKQPAKEPITLGYKVANNEVLTFKATASGGGLKGVIASGMGMSAKMEFKIAPVKKKGKLKGKLQITMGNVHMQGEMEKKVKEEEKSDLKGAKEEIKGLFDGGPKADPSKKGAAEEEGESKTTLVNPGDLSFFATAYVRATKKERKTIFSAALRTVKDDFSGIDVREIKEINLEKNKTSNTELMEDYPVYDLNSLLYLARYVKKFDNPKKVYFFERGILRPVEIVFGRKEDMKYQGKKFYAEKFIVSYKKKDLFKFYISPEKDRLPVRVEFKGSTLELINREVK